MLQTIGQVRLWVEGQILHHQMHIAGGVPWSITDAIHQGAVEALQGILTQITVPGSKENPLVDLTSPEAQGQLRDALNGRR